MRNDSNNRKDKRAKFTNTKNVKKQHVTRPRRRSWLVLVTVVGLGLGIWVANGALSGPVPSDKPSESIEAASLLPAPVAATSGHDPYPMVVPANGQVRLPVSLFDDGDAHHFTYLNGDSPIEFFVLRSADGTLRAAYNACDVCFQSKRGYLKEGDMMVCMNCGRRFPSDQINVVEGGCNPAPLQRTIDGDVLVLKEADILQGASFF